MKKKEENIEISSGGMGHDGFDSTIVTIDKKKAKTLVKTESDYIKHNDLNDNLSLVLFRDYRKMYDKVLSQKYCDIDGDFLGFVDVYFHLSKIIPKNWTVIDFGCAYNPQSYYFREHKKFIGVNAGKLKKFHFENTELFDGTISDYLKQKPEVEKVFAICNNVPSPETKLIREYYPNCYIYYTA